MRQELQGASLVGSCYREFAPHPALAGKVRAFFSFTPTAEPIADHRSPITDIRFGTAEKLPPSFADANASIVFGLGLVVDDSGQWRESSTPAANGGTLIGPMSRALPPNGREGVPAMVGAYFTSAQVAEFAAIPASEATDRIVALDDIIPSEARDLRSRLQELSEAQRIDVLEQALLKRLQSAREPHGSVDVGAIAAEISRRAGRVSVEQLADSAGVSRQHLTRVFKERLGVSPKMYCRLARFQAALPYAKAGARTDWAGVAFELGYADQSHMIAEFREFSSLTPHALATERWFHPFIER